MRAATALNAEALGKALVALVEPLPYVLAVGVKAMGRAFRIITVMDDWDAERLRPVCSCVNQLHRMCPEVKADSTVLALDDDDGAGSAARQVLRGDHQDFLWRRPGQSLGAANV